MVLDNVASRAYVHRVEDSTVNPKTTLAIPEVLKISCAADGHSLHCTQRAHTWTFKSSSLLGFLFF